MKNPVWFFRFYRAQQRRLDLRRAISNMGIGENDDALVSVHAYAGLTWFLEEAKVDHQQQSNSTESDHRQTNLLAVSEEQLGG